MTRLLVTGLAAGVLLLGCLLTTHAATTIDFESLYPGYETAENDVPDGYAGFDWDAGETQAHWMTDGYEPSRGYNSGYPGAINGQVGVYTPYEYSIGMQNGGTFDLTSLTLGAAWNDSQWAYVRGYLGATPLFSAHVAVPWGAAGSFVFNWAGIDKFAIAPDTNTGVWHPNMDGSGHHIVMDDIVINGTPPVTPELSSASLLLLGFLPVGLAAWRRRKS